ncbi:MAG TPA: TIGR03667 family PPOX class F420-dependent oxidoreductase, partial [Thermomicrobiales bacterium]|nr:TIGR03667 family PPOX class F420-dependent oxidoreductase [Thermomicrobiales bacterium]
RAGAIRSATIAAVGFAAGRELLLRPLDLNDPFDARVARHLEEDEVGWLTTVSPDGTPQPTPVWFLYDGTTLLIYSQPNQAKERNIARNPRVSFNFNTDAGGVDVVVITGSAAVDQNAAPALDSPAYLAKYGEPIVGIGMTPETFSQTYSVPIRFYPERLRGS